MSEDNDNGVSYWGKVVKKLLPRKFDRSRFLVDVEVKSLVGTSSFKAHALDLGQSGLAVFSRRFLTVGHPVELVFHPPGKMDATEKNKIVGRIVNARVESDGNILGIAFAQTLSSQEIESLETTLGVVSRR